MCLPAPRRDQCRDAVVAGPGVVVPRGAEPDKPRGILPERGVGQGIGPATSAPAACDDMERHGGVAAVGTLPNPFELNRILMLSYTICTDSSVNSWSKPNRSRWRGACCFSAGLDPAQNNCGDCFALCPAVQGLEIPHKRDLCIGT